MGRHGAERRSSRVWIFALSATAGAVLAAVSLRAEPVPVRRAEGVVHGFLVLRTMEGRSIADGDLTQFSRGDRVTSRLVFRFRDGSVHDETTVFSQRREFRLIRDHLVQTGPAFPQPLDMLIDAATGEVTVRYTDAEGEQKVETERLDLPPDVSNGLIPTLLKNVNPERLPKTLSFIAPTPKPRLVKLKVSSVGREAFSTGRLRRRATHYVLKVEIGGFSGALASLFGKEPPDSHVWIVGGEAPAFVRSAQQLYPGGPLWRIELATPSWPGQPR